MNFLGHLYLSGDNEEIITGNFIADHVKGKQKLKYSHGIQQGIFLHHQIDTYTDSHSSFLNCRSKLSSDFGKYSGVLVDMFFDHFLSAGWEQYHHENIDHFTARMYKVVLKRYHKLPPKTKRILPFMAKDNWLKYYGTFKGLHRALSGMDKRTPFESRMGEAVNVLKDNYDFYENQFKVFLPEIKVFTDSILHKIETDNNQLLP